jgi:carboxyl-terminal processing protease
VVRADSAVATNLPQVKLDIGEKEKVYKKIELLTEILMQVKRNYVDEKEYTEIVNGAIHGMLQSLDPHSDYLQPEAYSDMKEDTRGRYGGVGIHIGMRNDVLTVIAPIEDTPAFKAGLLAGDRIVRIDDEKTRKMDFGAAVDKIRGVRGTTVVLTVVREGEPKELDFEIRREFIEVASVKGSRIVREGIGYIRITQFSAPTAESFQNEIDELIEEGMQALVLDLRNNPGGLVKSAVNVAQKFLRKGELIVTTRGRKYRHGELEQRAHGDVRYLEMPLVILVNEGSASAAEIVAGALQDQGRAVLLGETTYGKGSVQSILPLRAERDSAIRMTTARYYTPSGKVIHDNGIEPDILVYVPPSEWVKVRRKRALLENADLYTEEEKKQFEGVRDRQLDRAVNLLEAMMIYEGIAGADVEE